VTFTFIEQWWASSFATDLVPIANPLSEKFASLRPSLLPGLIDSLAYNRRREAASVGLFEIGAVFSPASGERTMLGWVMTGPREEHWRASGDAAEFADAKGIAELVAAAWGVTLEADPAPDVAWLRDGRRARLTSGGRAIGSVGQLRAVRNVGDGDAIVGGEIDLEALWAIAAPPIRAIDPLPRHPSIVRDLSIFVAERLPAADVRATIRAHAPATLVAVREFDRYHGQGVPDGQVSLSLRLTFRDADRTLTDHEVQHAVDAIVAALVREHGAVLRGAAGAQPAE
jgi:phenylalanyl-tRNA synthetase beta chain